MKNGYYFFLCGYKETADEYTGILKKFEMQCNEFSKFFNIHFMTIYEKKHSSYIYKFTRRLFWNSADRNYNEIINLMNNPNFVYIRRTTADKKLIDFLRKIKELWPACKIILEFYTFPYEKDEYKCLPGKFSLLKDRIYRKQYKKYVDRIVTFTSDVEIYGVKTIMSLNGVDTNAFGAITPRISDDEVHLLAVAMFQKHHGYERIIEGIHNYFSNGGTRVVKLFLVGEGPEINFYRELTNKFGLNSNVVFYGRQQGQALDDIYNQSDIGLGTFGFYKIGLDSASSLKTKEYLAKGIPVAAGCVEEFVNDEGRKYYLAFSNDQSPVDINRLLQFYDSLYCGKLTKQMVADAIHEYAEKTVSMSVALKPIINFIGN